MDAIPGPRPRRRAGPRSIGLMLAVLMMTACVSYEAQPMKPLEILQDLNARTITLDESSPKKTLGPREAAAWAVGHHPALRAVRARLGIARAELVEAGVLDPIETSFDAADVIASKLVESTATTVDFVSGLGLSWGLPRPGEIDAKEGRARARIEEVKANILAAEWRLARDIHLAFVDLRAARDRWALNRRLLEAVKRTSEIFTEARRIGAATAIQDNLAAIEYATLLQQDVLLKGFLVEARQALNIRVGLRPDADVPFDLDAMEPLPTVQGVDRDMDLVREALTERPDFQALLYRYLGAEAGLRLQLALQWPKVSIGSGLGISWPILSSFNRPAIEVALARREQLAGEIFAMIHRVRGQVFAALARFRAAREAEQSLRETLLPRIEETTRLTEESFNAREITFLEILSAQRQVLSARRAALEARVALNRAAIQLDTVTGRLLVEPPTPEAKERSDEEEKR